MQNNCLVCRHGLVSKHGQKVHALIASLAALTDCSNLSLVQVLALRQEGLYAEARQVRIFRRLRIVDAVADPVIFYLARLVPAKPRNVMTIPVINALSS